MDESPYSVAITPAVLGIILGVVITTAFLGSSPDSMLYVSLPEYQLWRAAMIVQVSIYVSVAAYLYFGPQEVALPNLSLSESFGTVVLTMLVVIPPNLLGPGDSFPLHGQEVRMLLVIASALIAIVLVILRVARVFVGFQKSQDPETHAVLRRVTRDLLMISALVVTLGTLGTGVLQMSLAAMAEASSTYVSHLSSIHVLAYGGYFTAVLLLFFTPVLVAERNAAVRIVGTAEAPSTELESQLGLHRSLTEQLVSAFGILSPLLGALATQLI